ncbi:MAG: hypothetical protein SFU86_09570 [Pirellulaceae bacterium]|nr:hypothetical protein [Pirellulaceae bacterium]
MIRLSRLAVILCAWMLAASVVSSARADRPAAPRLLPERTLAYARIADTQLLVERFRETALGRIGQDEEVKPLVSQLYASAQQLWSRIEAQVGLPLDQLLRIPQGEICFAVVAPPEMRPGVIFLIDVKDQLTQARKLLDKGEELLVENGGRKEVEKVGEVEVAAYVGPDGNTLYELEREGTILIASDKELLRFVLSAWDGQAEKTLADSHKFNTIMSRCSGAVDDPPQLTLFADPVEIFRTVARGNFAATALALLPVLGLDGVQGIGASVTFGSGEFDSVQHVHLLLDNPRAGVLQLLAMSPGDSTPEPWVPAGIVSYSTFNWDLQQTYDKGGLLYNSLTSEGAFQEEVRRRVGDRLGVDFEKDLLPALGGRFTFAQWIEHPVRLNSMASLIGLSLKEPSQFGPTLETIVKKLDENAEKKAFGGVSYWTMKPLFRRPTERPDGPALRQPDPCVAIVGDTLLITDSSAALVEAIKTAAEPALGLAGDLEFKLIASKIKRQVGGDAPGMLSFSRPEQNLRFWYDLAAADDTRQQVNRRGENNPVFFELDKALSDNPLPPFAVLAKYLAPGGGMMVNDETGLHYTTFTLRRK